MSKKEPKPSPGHYCVRCGAPVNKYQALCAKCANAKNRCVEGVSRVCS